jgi:hypothetical protein
MAGDYLRELKLISEIVMGIKPVRIVLKSVYCITVI